MRHFYSLADIRHAYRLAHRSSAQAWIHHPTFPRPVATYAPTRRPLFNPDEVAQWVAQHRPAYVQGGC